VHYKGPYEQIEKAYLQIEAWLKKNNKQPAIKQNYLADYPVVMTAII
jgi:effector-binding domain-containing protein